eukprot:1996796-Pyramimonas_sp.AAC.1
MLEECVRRACQTAGGELGVDLHRHVRGVMRAWCSDGADLSVPLLAARAFPGLAFHAWDEAHSAQLHERGRRDHDNGPAAGHG